MPRARPTVEIALDNTPQRPERREAEGGDGRAKDRDERPAECRRDVSRRTVVGDDQTSPRDRCDQARRVRATAEVHHLRESASPPRKVGADLSGECRIPRAAHDHDSVDLRSQRRRRRGETTRRPALGRPSRARRNHQQSCIVRKAGRAQGLRDTAGRVLVDPEFGNRRRIGHDEPEAGRPREQSIAGVGAAKRTSSLIPLCHPLPLAHVDVTLTETPDGYEIEAVARTSAQTGVEMEALVAASAAALTIYDMCKSIDPDMVVEQVRLEEKTGGVRGDYTRRV